MDGGGGGGIKSSKGPKGQRVARSWVWKHFSKSPSQDWPSGKNKVMCDHCNREFSSATSTSTLKYHLEGTHGIKPDPDAVNKTNNDPTQYDGSRRYFMPKNI